MRVFNGKEAQTCCVAWMPAVAVHATHVQPKHICSTHLHCLQRQHRTVSPQSLLRQFGRVKGWGWGGLLEEGGQCGADAGGGREGGGGRHNKGGGD